MNLYTADEYERQAIAAILWHFYGPNKVVDGLNEAGLRTEDFRNPVARAVWTAAVALSESATMEMPTLAVVEWLTNHPEQMPDTPINVANLTAWFPAGQALPSDVFYEEAVVSIKKATNAQREVDRASRLLIAAEAEAITPDDLAELADEIAAEREQEQDRDAEGPVSGTDAVAKTMKEIADRREHGTPVGCVQTGYRQVDEWLDGGLAPGNLYILAARPSVGKTALALNVAVTAGKRSAVLFDSLEMPTRDVTVRMMAIGSGVGSSRIKSGTLSAQEHPHVAEAMAAIGTDTFAIDDEGGMPLLDLCRRARVWFRRRKAASGLLIVDYLQLVTVPERKGASRESEVSRVSSALKALAKRCNIPILALCQLNRAAEQAGRPGLHHLRESGSIEQDADVVMMLHRTRTTLEGGATELANESELVVAKNRNGPVGTAQLTFDPPTNRFYDGRRISDADIPGY
jgi:replicative DNA helicase